MNTVSRLSKINAKANNKNPMRFNGSLPITIEVLKSLGLNRYKLLLGTKEFTTKSQRYLEKGVKYWGSFVEGKAGIITISNLVKKPALLQDDKNFLDIELSEFLTQIEQVSSPISTFKSWIIESLASDDTKKEKFILFSDMLMALKDGVIHLPLKHKGKATLLQIKIRFDYIEFYSALDSLGPIHGYIKRGVLSLEVQFYKTYYFLKKTNITKRVTNIGSIEPFYSCEKLILDLKG